MARRTVEELRKAAERAGVKPGRQVIVTEIALGGGENHKSNYCRRGTIEKVYDKFFLCDMGGYKESFRYNEVLGTESGRRVKLHGI